MAWLQKENKMQPNDFHFFYLYSKHGMGKHVLIIAISDDKKQKSGRKNKRKN